MSSSEFSQSPDRLRDLAQQVLDHAVRQGASACEVDVSEGFGQSVTVRRNEVDTIEYNRDKGIGVSVYLGQRRGHARIRPPACPSRPCWPSSLPLWTSTIPGTSASRRPSSWPAAASRRPSR